MSKPQLLEWEMIWHTNPSVSVQLQTSYVATCTLFPDGTLNLKSDPEGRLQVPYYKLINMIEEARIVARHFYGEQWGEE